MYVSGLKGIMNMRCINTYFYKTTVVIDSLYDNNA